MAPRELPEVEVLRRDLDRDVGGRKIKHVEVDVAAVLSKTTTRKSIEALVGMKVLRVGRAAEQLRIDIQDDAVLLVQLSDRGYFERATARSEPTGTPNLTVSFTQGPPLRLVDTSKKSRVTLTTTEDVAGVLGERGMDVVEEPVSWTDFARALLSRNGKLRSILMDPTFLVGVGPMYSDEMLFTAGLRYDRDPRSLSAQEIRRLYRSVVETLHDAVKHGGTSVDGGFLALNGQPGGYGDYLAVFRREGKMSPRARGPVVKARVGSGVTYYCEQTQI